VLCFSVTASTDNMLSPTKSLLFMRLICYYNHCVRTVSGPNHLASADPCSLPGRHFPYGWRVLRLNRRHTFIGDNTKEIPRHIYQPTSLPSSRPSVKDGRTRPTATTENP